MVYSVFLVSCVLVGIMSAITAAEEALSGRTTWAVLWASISASTFAIAYYLVRD